MPDITTHTLTLVRDDSAAQGAASAYRVVLDGTEIGHVARVMVVRERRTPGRRYVDARWESYGWRYYPKGAWSGLNCDSRRGGIESLLVLAGLSWAEVQVLSATVRAVR